MKPQSPERIVIVERQGQGLAAVINFLFPSFGYLIQGRVMSFFAFWILCAIAVVIGVATAGVGLVALPLLWIWSIADAAKFKPPAATP